MNIVIKNGRVIDVANKRDEITNIAIENGKIKHVGNIPANFVADKTIDATDRWVLPGLIDSCNRPQMQHPQGTTLFDEAKAALKRGITSLCIPPDGDPILDTSANAIRLKQQSTSTLPAIYPIGALTTQLHGDAIADLTSLLDAGCIAFSNAQRPITDSKMLRHCYDYAASFNLTVIVQPQCAMLAKGGIAHEGIVATRLGLPGIPVIAESSAIAQHLLLMQETNVRGHFTCLSSFDGVNQIRAAKKSGLNISADTAMHQLHLSEMDVVDFNANCHVYPPLRSLRDKDALIEGINDGTIDAICSDHRPLDSIAKLAPFGESIPGLSAIDTFLALGLHLVEQNKCDLHAMIGAITYRAANLYHLPGGTLSLDADADICIVEPSHYWTVTESALFSKGKNSPFKGWQLPGFVTHTFLKGQLVHES